MGSLERASERLPANASQHRPLQGMIIGYKQSSNKLLSPFETGLLHAFKTMTAKDTIKNANSGSPLQ